MTYWTRLLSEEVKFGASAAGDERFWGGFSSAVSAGVRVTKDTALKLSTAWACSRLLSETVASLPLHIYRRMPNGAREEARDHPLYAVLHDQPNENMTAFEFFDCMTHAAVMTGNAIARIQAGPRGFADQLIPYHPDRVMIRPLANGRMLYDVIEDDGQRRTLTSDEVLHLRGPSFDGRVGVSLIAYANESFGVALARQAFGARFYRNNASPNGVLIYPGKLTEKARKNLRESWETVHGGENQGRIALLEENLKYQPVGISQKDAQYIEAEEYGAEDVCRWFRVPPHMVGLTSKATSWGSGIEQMSIGFVTYTLMPWLIRWKQAISRDLILATDTYFADFVVAALLRGDLKTRYEAYAIARNWGWLSVNDILAMENRNPIENGDIYLQPLNMVPVGAMPSRSNGSTPVNTGSQANYHYPALLKVNIERIVRKETAALKRLAVQPGWEAGVAEFFAKHAGYVAQSIAIPEQSAMMYAQFCRDDALARGPNGLDGWEAAHTEALLALVERDRHETACVTGNP